MYEPSEQIKKQIAAEYWDLDLCKEGGCYESASKICQDYSISIATKWSNLPTIKKALELLETKPQWQDKPDKEGWYCVMAKGRQCGWYWLYTPVNPVYVYKQKGALYLRKYDVEDFILKDYTLSEYLKRYKDYDGIKFLYIPEPEPYKGEE